MEQLLLLLRLNLLEAIRRRLHLLTLLAAVGMCALPSYMAMFGLPPSSLDRLCKDFGLTVVAFLGAVLAAYLGSTSLPSERDGRSLHALLTRPVPRHSYILAKVLSIVTQIGAAISLWTLCFSFSLAHFSEAGVDGRMFEAALGYWVETSVLALVCLVVSIWATPAVAAVLGLAAYLSGSLTDSNIFAVKEAVMQQLAMPGTTGSVLTSMGFLLLLAFLSFSRKEL